jgi:hypothetical protein
MNRANLSVAANVDASVLATTDGWSAPLADTHREAGPRMLQLAPADTLRVRPWKLAFGVLPHDGPPEQLQHPEAARRRGSAGQREHLLPPGIAGSGVTDSRAWRWSVARTHRSSNAAVRADRDWGVQPCPGVGVVAADRLAVGPASRAYTEVLAACPQQQAATPGQCGREIAEGA